MLRALGPSAQVPPTRTLERDERHIRKSVRDRWPEIFRGAFDGNHTVVYLDVREVLTSPDVRRS